MKAPVSIPKFCPNFRNLKIGKVLLSDLRKANDSLLSYF